MPQQSGQTPIPNESDVYKRQVIIFAYLRPEKSILGLILEDDDDDE